MNDLARFSIDQLIEELARRRNESERQTTVAEWCEDCVHFRFAKSDAEADRIPPCSKGHKMKFRMPESPADDEWGFYKRVCADREKRP